MRIENEQLPFAGEPFSFLVTDAVGKTSIDVYIDAKPLRYIDCPDPPCYEMVMIPSRARGSVLRIIATDFVGNKEEVAFEIAGTDPIKSVPDLY